MSEVDFVPDIIVVGGGPAGSYAAINMRRQGKNILLLEKEPEAHHKVCGEFISCEAAYCLKDLGINLDALGAQKINSVRVVKGDKSVPAPLPFQAYGLSRMVMDETLLELAEREGVHVKRGVAVTVIEKENNNWKIEWTGGKACAKTLFLATGKHDIKGWNRPAGRESDYIGFKIYYYLTPAQNIELSQHVEVILFDGGYAGLQLVENGKANLCLVVRKSRFKDSGKNWEDFLNDLVEQTPHLAARLEGATPQLSRPLATYGIPYGFLFEPSPADLEGLYRLGDQMGVIPSFSGEGISIAFHTSGLATKIFEEGANAYHRRAAKELALPLTISTCLMRFATSPLSQTFFMAICRLQPYLLTFIARKTRLAVLP